MSTALYRGCNLLERNGKVITAVDFPAIDLAMGLKPSAESNQESYILNEHVVSRKHNNASHFRGIIGYDQKTLS